MNLPFKVVISDLDGTLLDSSHKIGQFTAEILQQLSILGIHLIFATGRNHSEVSYLIQSLSLQNATLITSNGAIAHKLNGELLYADYLPEQVATELMHIPFDEQRICLNSYQNNNWYINTEVPQLKAFHQNSGLSYQVVDFCQHHPQQTEKIFYIAKSASDLTALAQQIKDRFADKVQITYSSPQCLEIMNQNVSKQQTLKRILTLLNYQLADCIAFGDGMNDLDMLRYVAKGCVMENADPRLKNLLPDNEIIGHHKDEAVANYLHKLFKLP